jgi:CBS domain containing-hemolysin-like protein
MLGTDVWLLVTAAALVFLAGLFSAADAALSSFSHARAEEIAGEGRAGSKRLLQILDDPPRYLNTTLLLRMACEVGAIVLVTLLVADHVDGWWPAVLTSIGVMLVVSFVVVGVAPRTLGRQHATQVALVSAAPLLVIARILGPIPKVLILFGNAITPGRGFSEGPFSTETELRELVDLAEASAVIESGERRMIHSVFELGDTSVREVMVPRNDVVFIERYKNLRQTMSLFLRSGYSRIPVVGENLDDIVGFAYLKDVTKRVFDNAEAETTERIDQRMRPVHWVPDSKPADELLTEMQARRQHIAVVVDEYGGTAGIVTIEDVLEEIVGEITDEYDEAQVEVETLSDSAVRVSSRYPVDDLDEIFPDVDLVDDEVDSVGGLMAKLMGRVPIPGSSVEANGLRFEAEAPSGRRNRVGTVVIRRIPAAVIAEHAEPVDREAAQQQYRGQSTRNRPVI